MPVTQTSKDAYKQVDLSRQQYQVLAAIKVLGETCISDVAGLVRWERSTVAGRMNELKKLGEIVYIGKRKSKITKVACEFWRVRNKETLWE